MGHWQRLLQAPAPAEESLSLSSNSEGRAPDWSLFSHRAGWHPRLGGQSLGKSHDLLLRQSV